MRYASGQVLTPEGFIDGHVGFEDGVVREVGKGGAKAPVAQGIIVPTLINSHTHIADYVVPLDLHEPLEKLVAPPNGLKHRVLEQTSEKKLKQAMVSMSLFMRGRGVTQFADFREGGYEGSRLLSSLRGGCPRPLILGRPKKLQFDWEEVDQILSTCEGIGVSSIADWDYGIISELSSYVRSKGKMFALHASERVREDIDRVLDLKPSFLVHMTMATKPDIEACAGANVPIVLCARSNLFFGREPPLAEMIRAGAMVALGTDNAMICLPDVLLEMEFAGRLLRKQGLSDLRPVFDMATKNGRKLLNEKSPIAIDGIEPGQPCDFMVIRSHGGDPFTDLVLRSSSTDPLMVCLGREAWRGPL
jgi:cytosine/adenosine deaminase-related metal-dependent hydrolase